MSIYGGANYFDSPGGAINNPRLTFLTLSHPTARRWKSLVTDQRHDQWWWVFVSSCHEPMEESSSPTIDRRPSTSDSAPISGCDVLVLLLVAGSTSGCSHTAAASTTQSLHSPPPGTASPRCSSETTGADVCFPTAASTAVPGRTPVEPTLSQSAPATGISRPGELFLGTVVGCIITYLKV